MKGALMNLKRAKAYEEQAEKVYAAKLTLESQIMSLESASVSLQAMNAMKLGASSMRSLK